MRKVILEGDERTVERIINENRVRVGRGLVKFSPAEDAATDDKEADEPDAQVDDTKKMEAEDTKEVAAKDSKEVPAEDAKVEPAIEEKKPKSKK